MMGRNTLCMVGSRCINLYFQAVLRKGFLGPKGRVSSFCDIQLCTNKKTVIWMMMHII